MTNCDGLKLKYYLWNDNWQTSCLWFNVEFRWDQEMTRLSAEQKRRDFGTLHIVPALHWSIVMFTVTVLKTKTEIQTSSRPFYTHLGVVDGSKYFNTPRASAYVAMGKFKTLDGCSWEQCQRNSSVSGAFYWILWKQFSSVERIPLPRPNSSL